MGRIKNKEMPHLWKHGTDETTHVAYRKYYIAKNQAVNKNQVWSLSFDEWLEIWGDNIINSGRKIGQYYIKRKNSARSWNKDNIVLRINGVRINGKHKINITSTNIA